MVKRTKFQIKKAATQRAVQHFDKMVGGMAAIISAYLLAISTKFIALEGVAFYAACTGTFSLVILIIFKIFSFFEAEGDMKDKNPLPYLFSIGLTSGLLTYWLVLISIDPLLALIASITFFISLIPFVWAFKSES